MRTRYTLLALLLLITGTIDSSADIISPDSKRVRHLFRIEKLEDYTNYIFYIYPRDLDRGSPGNSSVQVSSEGVNIGGLNPLAVHQAGGVYLFAIPAALHGPKTELPKESWFRGLGAGILKCKVPSEPIPLRSRTDPINVTEDFFTVSGLPNRLELSRVRRVDRADAPLPIGPRGVQTSLLMASSTGLVMVGLRLNSRARSRRARRDDAGIGGDAV